MKELEETERKLVFNIIIDYFQILVFYCFFHINLHTFQTFTNCQFFTGYLFCL